MTLSYFLGLASQHDGKRHFACETFHILVRLRTPASCLLLTRVLLLWLCCFLLRCFFPSLTCLLSSLEGMRPDVRPPCCSEFPFLLKVLGCIRFRLGLVSCCPEIYSARRFACRTYPFRLLPHAKQNNRSEAGLSAS